MQKAKMVKEKYEIFKLLNKDKQVTSILEDEKLD